MRTKNKVVNDLIRMIRNETFAGGAKIPAIRQLCQELDTSYVTMSKAIAELKAQGILSTSVGKGTFVTPSNHHPFKSKAFSGEEICYVFTNDENNSYENYQIEIYCELQKLARSNGFIDRAIIPVDGICSDFDPHKVAGIVVDSHQPFVDELIEKKIPVVYCSSLPPRKNLNSATPDFYQGSYLVTQHLLDCGYPQIYHVGPYHSGNQISFVERYEGYCDAMRDAKYKPEKILQWHHTHCVNQVKEVIRKAKTPMAFYAANDVMASEILALVHKMDVYNPKMIGIAGLENMRCSAGMTTAQYCKKELAQTAFNLLMAMIDGQAVNNMPQRIPMNLLRRETTARITMCV